MSSAAVNSKVMDMLLMFHPCAAPTVCKSFVLGSCFVMYMYVHLSILSSLAFILLRKRELVALL